MRREDSEPGAAADLIYLIEQVDNVEAELGPLVDTGVDPLEDAEIHLLIAGQSGSVRNGAVGLSRCRR